MIDHQIKFCEDRSFRCGDIWKTILGFFNCWFSMYFSYFLNYAPPKPSEMENYGMVLAFFGNHISKCNRLSKNIRPIQAIEVLRRLRNKQKLYLIYQETPCIIYYWPNLDLMMTKLLMEGFWDKTTTNKIPSSSSTTTN